MRVHNQEEILTKNQIAQRHDLGLPSLQIYRNKCGCSSHLVCVFSYSTLSKSRVETSQAMPLDTVSPCPLFLCDDRQLAHHEDIYTSEA